MKKKIFDVINTFFIIPFIIIIFSDILYCLFNDYNIVININSFILNYLIIFSVYVILYGLIGKSNISYTIFIIFFLIIFIVNQFKIIFTASPLFISDLKLVKSGGNIVTMVGSSIFNYLYLNIWLFLLLLFICLLLIFYCFRYKYILFNKLYRLLYVVGGIFILLILFIPNSFTKNIYLELFYDDIDGNYVDKYAYYGVIGGMYHQLLSSRVDVPYLYDEDVVDKELNDSEIDYDKSLGKPNVIVILSESFFDISKISENITFDSDITYNFNYIGSNNYIVDLVSPSYGGLTANVAFEVITGGNLSYFGEGYIPIMNLYNNNYTKPSIALDLKNNGYYNEIILGEDSYDSYDAFMDMGFDKYTKLEVDDSNRDGYYISDDYIYNYIINRLEDKTISGNKFLFVETMESHMSYDINKYDSYDISISKSNLSSYDNDTLLSYAQGIYDDNKMLMDIYNYIMDYDEDTIVIFFGDHLPYLKNDLGEDIMDKLEYFNTSSDLINTFRKYNTQSVIFSNYDMDIDIPSYMGTDMLLTYIVNNMDIDISNYYRLLYKNIDKLYGYNRYVSVTSNYNICYTNKLYGDSLDYYNLRNMIMYKLFIEK